MTISTCVAGSTGSCSRDSRPPRRSARYAASTSRSSARAVTTASRPSNGLASGASSRLGPTARPFEHFDQEEVAGAAAAVHRKIPRPRFETGECLRVAADRADQLPGRRFVIGDWPLLDGAHARFDEAAPGAFDEAAVPPVATQQAEIERPRPGGVPSGGNLLVGPLHAEREGDVVGGADGEDRQRNVGARQRLGRSRNRAIAPGRDHQLRRRLGQTVRVALGIDHAHDLVTGARQRFPQGGERRAMARAVIEEHRNSHVSQP